VLFVDLDNFKDVNDGFGHESGDQLLRAITARLRGVARNGDLIARLGGDEFAIVLRGVDNAQQGLDAAGRYLAIFTEPFALGGLSLISTASIGLQLRCKTKCHTDNSADVTMFHIAESGAPSAWPARLGSALLCALDRPPSTPARVR
jgi:diguanylate cyclase